MHIKDSYIREIGMMKKIILLFIGFLILSSSPLLAQERLDKTQIKKLCNTTMVNIYNDILVAKSRYPDLKNFNLDSLKKDDEGIYSIEYSADPSEGKYSKNRVFALGISIVGIEEVRYYRERGSFKKIFEFGFPLLGIKFQGYKQRGLRSKEFDIEGSVQKNGKLLLMEQDKYLPLQIIIESKKENFKVNEPVSFNVTLKNRSDKSYVVKDLDSNSLFFVYGDNTIWGAKEIGVKKYQSAPTVLLKPGRSITKTFNGTGFSIPKEYEISGFYVMTFNGVNPTGLLKIKVVPE